MPPRKRKTAAGDASEEPPAKKSQKGTKATPSTHAALTSPSTRNYWLMKAEPTTRLENGHDVKFSIDDLAARTRPEPWDGIRNHVAKNNLLAMKRGDLAFFYHSNCKVPGIVGVMEIVQEASPDETAWDSKSAYYDAKSGPDKRTWYLVHVEFRRKFKDIVGLKELQGYKGNGQALEGMQLLKQSRLSVSKVAEKEWEFIMGLAEGKEAE
ncbi:DUF55-domain-containing protein [Lophium mytilinum]|uniref:Thymocyte nuclear protein 1 n=1 Tax=Lophium mytilinum TaxID=390894 RepID=A0A6A6QSG8_9PEZI|nr:DUF55-domain-containing protein [Lophium mytilinum]